MEFVLIGLYLISMTLIMIFSLVQFDLSLRYLKEKKRKKNETEKFPPLGNFPLVTVQLPVYNEQFVIKRLVNAVADLDYPRDRIQIQVLDDSTDETTPIIAGLTEKLSGKGIHIDHLHRRERKGYKAGALEEGLKTARGEFIAIFDADFIPDRDFLKKTLPAFHNPHTGMVQTRWSHINEHYSLLTRLQAFGLNAHFTAEQVGRSAAGSFINFNGTAGIWRKKCIEDSGGWALDTLSEDLELSYRAQLKGWKFKYLENITSPAELPVVLSAIRSQQYRWTKGGSETARKTLLKFLRTPSGFVNKLHGIFHLLNSTVFPLLLIAAFCSIPLLFFKQSNPEFKIYFDIGSVFLIGFFAIAGFYWISSLYNHPRNTLKYYLIHFPLFLSFTLGLSLQNGIAVFEGLAGIKTPFVRTPKFNISSRQDKPGKNPYINYRLSWQNFLELFLVFYFLFGVAAGIYLQDFGLVLFHLMLAIGFAAIVIYTIINITIRGK